MWYTYIFIVIYKKNTAGNLHRQEEKGGEIFLGSPENKKPMADMLGYTMHCKRDVELHRVILTVLKLEAFV